MPEAFACMRSSVEKSCSVMQAKASGIELKPENVPVGDGLSS